MCSIATAITQEVKGDNTGHFVLITICARVHMTPLLKRPHLKSALHSYHGVYLSCGSIPALISPIGIYIQIFEPITLKCGIMHTIYQNTLNIYICLTNILIMPTNISKHCGNTGNPSPSSNPINHIGLYLQDKPLQLTQWLGDSIW